jgi:hypothetical protein
MAKFGLHGKVMKLLLSVLNFTDAGRGCLYRLQVRSNENQAWTDVSDKIDQNVHIVTGSYSSFIPL